VCWKSRGRLTHAVERSATMLSALHARNACGMRILACRQNQLCQAIPPYPRSGACCPRTNALFDEWIGTPIHHLLWGVPPLPTTRLIPEIALPKVRKDAPVR